MARKPRAAQSDEGENGGENPHDKKTSKMVSAGTLSELLKAGRDMKEQLDDLTTDFATMVREAVAKKGLHKGVFDTIKKLDKFTPEKLAEWREHFDHQWTKSGLEKRAASAPKFSAMPGAGASESAEGDTPVH